MTQDPRSIARWDRFEQLLAALGDLGLSQGQIASRVGVPQQYISDIKNRRRGLSELTARRFSDEFGVSTEWLLLGQGQMKRLMLSDNLHDQLSVPMLDVVHIGPPQDCPSWIGTWIEIAGVAAHAASKAKLPYVLRLPHSDRAGRFVPGDLLLISQDPKTVGHVAVLVGNPPILARRKALNDRWTPVQEGVRIKGKPEVAGAVLGLIWAPV